VGQRAGVDTGVGEVENHPNRRTAAVENSIDTFSRLPGSSCPS
jgi:hypothetical protein